MFNQVRKIAMLIALAVIATACAGNGGGLTPPNAASGKLPFGSAAGVLGMLAGPNGAMDQMLRTPSGTSLNSLGLQLPAGFDDPSAKYVRNALGVYDSCITVTTTPYKKYVMNCRKVDDNGTPYDYVGTIDFIKNDIPNEEYHYEFDYYWWQYATPTTGEGGEYKGSYKYKVDGTIRTSESKYSVNFKDNRVGNWCKGGKCDADYTHISNWKVTIDSSDDSTDIDGFLAFKGKSNFTNGGWDGNIDVSFEIKVENFMVDTNGLIQSGTMTMIDGSGNKTVLTWSGGSLGTVTYNGISITL